MKKLKLKNLNKLKQLSKKSIIVCWGFFDGVHQGHQVLFEQVKLLAQNNDYLTAIITFDIKPQQVINGVENKVLLSNEDKFKIISQYGFTYYLEIAFSKEIAQILPEQFIDFLISLNVKAVVVSPTVRFGVKGKGNLALLEQSKLQVYLCDEIKKQKVKVSSTYIKALIQENNFKLANELMQEPYRITGKVVPGRQEGRKIGFPTANLELSANYVLPKLATYISLVLVENKWYEAMTVIMMRDGQPLVESYLLNFTGNLYGKIIKVQFLHFLRENIKFTTFPVLIKQLEIDLKNTISYFKEH